MEKYEVATVYTKVPPRFDIVTRIFANDDSPQHYYVQYLTDTDSFVSKAGNLLKENEILKNVVKNLWKNYLYNQEYTSYLLGTHSKDDFLRIAEEYAEKFNVDINYGGLMFSIDLISSILNQPLTSNDFSIMLNVETSCIDTNLKELPRST